MRRQGASGAISLDDTYEMAPDGLHFDKPALFTLEAGAAVAVKAGDAEQRWLGYVREDGSIAPFALPIASPSQGMFSGEIFHFSSAGTAASGAQSGSGPFGALASKSVETVPHPLSAKKCRDLQNQYVPADPKTGQPLAAEANVECRLGSAQYASAAGSKGQTCVRLTGFSPASKSRVDYHEWKDAPAKCKPAWDAFQNKLAAHEAEHLKIGQQICADAFAAVPVTAGGVLGCGKTRRRSARQRGQRVRRHGALRDRSRAVQARRHRHRQRPRRQHGVRLRRMRRPLQGQEPSDRRVRAAVQGQVPDVHGRSVRVQAMPDVHDVRSRQRQLRCLGW